MNLQETICCKSFGDVRFDLEPLLQGQTGQVRIKVPITRLLMVLEICNIELTFRKPYAANLLAMSDLTLGRSFKVKLGLVRIKVPITRLLLVLEVYNVQSTFRKPYAANLLAM